MRCAARAAAGGLAGRCAARAAAGGSAGRSFAGRAAAGLLVVTVAACGGGGGGRTPAPPPHPTVTVGVVVPESGSLGSVGRGMVTAVRLAVADANARNAIPGWKIRVDAEDDEARPDAGARAASKLAKDTSVIGVVGPLNSTVALTVGPVLAQAGVALVSPSASDVTLTDRQATDGRVRPYSTFFRLVATDDAEGPLAARFAATDLHARRVVAISEDLDYARRMTAQFETAARGAGATALPTVVLPTDADSDAPDPNAVVGEILADAPTAVFLVAGAPIAARITKRLRADGLTVPIIGSDDLRTPAYLSQAGKAADGVYAVDFGAPPGSTAAGRDFLARLDEAGGPATPTAVASPVQLDDAADGYDATNVLLRAAATALARGTAEGTVDAAARTATVRAVASTSFDGLTGPVSFDRFGDVRRRVLTLYRVQGRQFVAVRTETVP